MFWLTFVISSLILSPPLGYSLSILIHPYLKYALQILGISYKDFEWNTPVELKQMEPRIDTLSLIQESFTQNTDPNINTQCQ